MDSILNKQEVFSKVKKHLLKQNRQAKSVEKGCRYKTQDGKKCAIGCLIEEKFYSSNLESCSVAGILNYPNYVRYNVLIKALKQSLKLKEISTNDLIFLSDLQYVHDYEPIIDWPFRLKTIAEKYGLEYK
jgi:hypothetical protein